MLPFITIWFSTNFAVVRSLNRRKRKYVFISSKKKCVTYPSYDDKIIQLISLDRNAVVFCIYSVWNSAHGIFSSLISAKTAAKPSPETDTPCPSVLSVPYGSTTDDTAAVCAHSLEQRPYWHCGTAQLARALIPLSADWLKQLSITFLPGNADHLLLWLPVAPFYSGRQYSLILDPQ